MKKDMDRITDILATTFHRQYPLPAKPWKQYQQWHENLFMHWKVQPTVLSAFLPGGLEIDTINADAWVSIIAFSVKNLRPRFLPAVPMISNFHEVNFRTYVTKDGIPGIYFFSIEAGKLLPALLARLLIGLPYFKSDISRNGELYSSRNARQNKALKATYTPGPPLQQASGLDYWLTERHALYQQNGNKLHRIDVHHKPWPLQQVEIYARISGYPLIDSVAAAPPNLVHYAERIDVLVWGRESV